MTNKFANERAVFLVQAHRHGIQDGHVSLAFLAGQYSISVALLKDALRSVKANEAHEARK